MDVAIVDADLGDPGHARGLLDVLDSYARDPVGAGRPLQQSVRDRLIPRLAAQHNALILLALGNGTPIGVAICFFGFSTFAARPLLNIHDLAVLPKFRGLGIGRSLLTAAESRARQLDCCKITLEVREDNERARSLYHGTGFVDFSPGEDPTPTLFLEKRLGPPPERA
jgi:GNAT superfamily N-acetyltransferase